MRAILRSLIAATGLSLGATLSAQTVFTWTGLGVDGNVSTAANWLGGVAPAGNPTDQLVFPQLNLSGFIPYYPQVNAPLAVDDIAIISPSNYYGIGGTGPLTLHGDVNVYSYVNLGVPLVLTAGNHIFNTEVNGDANAYGYLELSGLISGAGTLVKNGDGTLVIGFSESSNTYSGGTIINEGILEVSGNNRLAFGAITFNSGTLTGTGGGAQLANDFLLGANVTFYSNVSDGQFVIGNGEGSDITPVTGVTTVNLNLAGRQPLYIESDMRDGVEATTYTFSGSALGQSYYVLSAFNSYTGGTIVHSGASVLFQTSYAVPEEGSILVQAGGYAGLSTIALTPQAFVSHFDVNSAGTIGFDSGLTFAGDIDLGVFANSNLSLGTRTSATLTGLITPVPDGDFSFTSSGALYLTGSNALSDNRGLVSRTLQGSEWPGLVVLGQSVPNTYTGDTVADAAAIIFDTAGSLTASGALVLNNGGYIGFTESSGLTLDDLANRVGAQAGLPGVLGIDTHSSVFFHNNVEYSYGSNIDLAALPHPVYIGTSSHVHLSGDIVTTDDGTEDYFLTGYNGGALRVSSLLTGDRALYVGLWGDHNSYSSVQLDNDLNDFTDGTTIHSGVLFASSPAAIGPGPLAAETIDYDQQVSFVTNGTVPNDIALVSGILNVLPENDPVILTGTITGSGQLAVLGNDGAAVTISGNNTYDGGSHFGDMAEITATSNTALGTGGLELTEGATVRFTAPNPVIGNLYEGSAYIYDDDDYYRKDAALVIAGGGSSTLTINHEDYGYFEGAILQEAGTVGSVVKDGSGILTIWGDNYDGNNPHATYTGGTTIINGTLIAGSSTALGPGTITLNGPNASLGTTFGVTLANPIAFGVNGGILSGSGKFSTPITAGSNVVLSPGESPGVLEFTSGLTLAPGGSLDFEVQTAMGAAGTGYDLVHISNGLLNITATAGSPFTINILSLDGGGNAGNVADFSAASGGYSWMLYLGNSGSGINGFDPTKFTLNTAGFTNNLNGGVFSLSLGSFGSDPVVFLNFTAVPEPSTYALLALGLGATLMARRRRR